jgi:ribosomal protein S18 acetylase RimI-like enzyme
MSATFTIRAPRIEEVEAATELLNEHSRRLHGADDTVPAEIRQYWESPDVDFERDVLLAEAPDGSILGYADLGVEGEHVWLDIRGLELESLRALRDAIQLRAAERKPGAPLLGFLSAEDRLVRQVYDEAGYRPIRHSFRMEIDVQRPMPSPAGPPDVVMRPMRDGEEEQVYEVHEQSFEDAWMHTREPFDQWQYWFMKTPSFDPSLWFVAEMDGEIVGVAICRVRETEASLGWVSVLGVLRSHRRRGIGEALLRHAFAEFARRGCGRVGLGVDAESPTGAVPLYERAGMHVARRNLQVEKLQG